jgi:hypothetical protein
MGRQCIRREGVAKNSSIYLYNRARNIAFHSSTLYKFAQSITVFTIKLLLRDYDSLDFLHPVFRLDTLQAVSHPILFKAEPNSGIAQVIPRIRVSRTKGATDEDPPQHVFRGR